MTFITSAQAGIDLMLSRFGESQVWTPAVGAAVPFTGIAEIEFQQIDLASGAVLSFEAAVIGKTSVIGAAKQGDAITLTSALNGVSAAAYSVTLPQNSPADLGPGLTRLGLRKA